jgi:hypothetical protein
MCMYTMIAFAIQHIPSLKATNLDYLFKNGHTNPSAIEDLSEIGMAKAPYLLRKIDFNRLCQGAGYEPLSQTPVFERTMAIDPKGYCYRLL